jgi:hypothetical protein
MVWNSMLCVGGRLVFILWEMVVISFMFCFAYLVFSFWLTLNVKVLLCDWKIIICRHSIRYVKTWIGKKGDLKKKVICWQHCHWTVCVCVCVFVYACVYMCVCLCVCVCVWLCVCMWAHFVGRRLTIGQAPLAFDLSGEWMCALFKVSVPQSLSKSAREICVLPKYWQNHLFFLP